MTPPPRKDKTWSILDQPECGVFEIARYMGVSKGRVSQYTAASWFPKPSSSLGMGRVWKSKHVVDAYDKHKASTARHRPPSGFATDHTPKETS